MIDVIKRDIQKYVSILIVFLTSLAISLPFGPFFSLRGGRDSGVFLYGAWMMLQGKTLYVDIWDHKPPVIFIINMFGLILGNGSRYGVWLIEFLCILISLFFLVKILTKHTSFFTSMIVCVLYLFGFYYLVSGGNLTEEYALPIQFGMIMLFGKLLEGKSKIQYWFLFGLLTGISFLIKPTTIGISLAFIIYWIIIQIRTAKLRNTIFCACSYAIGFILLPFALFVIYRVNHHLPELVDALINYNMIYTAKDPISYLKALNFGFFTISQIHLGTLAALGIIIGSIKVFSKDTAKETKTLISILLISLPIEIIFAVTASRQYLHYFVTLLPVLAIFSGIFIHSFIECLSKNTGNNRWIQSNLVIVLLILLNSTLLIEKYSSYTTRKLSTANQFLIANTSPSDSVLFWGANSFDNFIIKRASPTKYVYLLPLYMNGYGSRQVIEDFLQDVLSHKPKFIINPHDANVSFLEFGVTSPEIEADLNMIKSNYRLVKSLDGWDLYKIIQ